MEKYKILDMQLKMEWDRLQKAPKDLQSTTAYHERRQQIKDLRREVREVLKDLEVDKKIFLT